MSIRTILANLVAGNQPVSLIDQLFQDVWNAATMSCTASGTNAITLTPRANVNAPTAYVPNQRFAFDAAATSTGLVTVQVGSLAVLKLFQPGGGQAGAGSLTSGTYYEIAYDPTLDSGNGGFTIMNSTLPTVAQPTQGDFKNLLITNTTAGTPASQLVVTCDAAILWNTSNGAVTVTSVNVTINSAVNGANGLDTGALAANTWYYVWLIFNPQTLAVAGLISLSSTTPTMPAGFTFKQRVGAIRAGAGPAFLNMMQRGRRAQYMVGTFGGNALAAAPNIANGTAGTFSSTAPVWASVSVVNFVPATASEISIIVTNDWNNLGTSNIQVAPNSNYAGALTTNPPPLQAIAATTSTTISLLLESTNISWTSSTAGGGISALGWVDNI
jgi:hypothetical protein